MRPKAWSFSVLESFRNCPKAYAEVKVYKTVKDAGNAAGAWGDYVHRQFEKWFNGVKAKAHPILPDALKEYLPYLMRLATRKGEMHVECKYGLDMKLQPIEMKTDEDWYRDDIWLRIIIDLLHIDGDVAWALDHKTGKVKEASDQLMLFALVVFIFFPQVNTVHTQYAWLQFGKWTKKTYHRSDISWMWQHFVPDLVRFKNAFHTETFPAKTSGLCYGWCPVTKCQHWKPKRAGR